MRRWLAAILVLCAGAGICFYLFFRSGNQKPAEEQKSADAPPTATNITPPIKVARAASVQTNPPVQIAAPITAETNASSIAAGPKSTPANWPRSGPQGLGPDIVLRNARAAVTQYGSMFHGNPVGNNAEITSSLNGSNPKQVKFIGAESGLQINDQGELVDPWGTPFFFHQRSAKEMEVRSAGPDKIMWTADDLVAR